MSVKEVFIYLESLGLLNVVIPFVLVFVVLYAVLKRIKLFKETKVNALLSALIAFIAIAAADVVRNVGLFSYYLVLLLFAVVAVFMLIALLGGKLDLMSEGKKKYTGWIVAIALCLGIVYAVYRAGVRVDVGINYFWLRSLIPLIIAVLVFVLVIWFITSPAEKVARRPAREEVPAVPSAEEPGKQVPSEQKGLPKWVLEKKIKEFPETGKIKT